MAKQALVLGATGGIGGEVAAKLLARGWRVHALTRHAASRPDNGIRWHGGDALNRDDVLRAAAGSVLIVHAVNPPGYRNWGQWVLPMIANTIAAAEANGARIVLPGTVYNYAAGDRVITEATPQDPDTRKGEIRVMLESRLQQAAAQGRARTLIVRAGDYFGPRSRNSWFAQGLIKPGRPIGAVNLLGTVGHQWAYLPDVAETMLRLVELGDALDDHTVYQMAGHWDGDGEQLVGAIIRASSRPDLAWRRFPWWLVRALAPVVPLMRELREIQPYWRHSLRLANDKLVATLGAEPRTPLDLAVATTLRGLGCLPDVAGAAAEPARA